MSRPQATPDDKYRAFQELKQLLDGFIQQTKHYGKIIIEMSPSEREDISLKGKGIAGGQKFIFDDIFFKFAKDDNGIYQGDAFAQKAAGHELRSMVEIVNLQIPELHLPLACIIE